MAKKYTYSIVGNTKVCDNTGEIKAVKLGGIWFDMCGTSDSIAVEYGNDDCEIYTTYGKPSDTKVEIWYQWCAWARENDAVLRISGHSCCFFSIYGTITDTDGTQYNLYITYANRRCTIVK